MRKIYFLIIILLCLFIMVGCNDKEPNYEKHLVSFSYSYGNSKEGLYDYSIILNGDNIKYIESSSNNKISYKEIEIDNSYLDKIEKLIIKYDILNWDGFNKHDDIEDNNEISFSIQIGYDDGSNYNASGYMNYPDNFDKVHKELLRIFNELNNKE